MFKLAIFNHIFLLFRLLHYGDFKTCRTWLKNNLKTVLFYFLLVLVLGVLLFAIAPTDLIIWTTEEQGQNILLARKLVQTNSLDSVCLTGVHQMYLFFGGCFQLKNNIFFILWSNILVLVLLVWKSQENETFFLYSNSSIRSKMVKSQATKYFDRSDRQRLTHTRTHFEAQ